MVKKVGRETSRTTGQGTKANMVKKVDRETSRTTGQGLLAKGRWESITQDMACWKVVARVSQNTVCGLLEGLLEG